MSDLYSIRIVRPHVILRWLQRGLFDTARRFNRAVSDWRTSGVRQCATCDRNVSPDEPQSVPAFIYAEASGEDVIAGVCPACAAKSDFELLTQAREHLAASCPDLFGGPSQLIMEPLDDDTIH